MTNQPSSSLPKSWLKIIIDAPESISESMAAFLSEITGTGVECIAASEQDATSSSAEQIIGYLEINPTYKDKLAQVQIFLNTISAESPSYAAPRMHTEIIRDQDWGKEWKKHFKPEKISERFVVKPSWEEYLAAEDEIVIELDPGMAFGTGHHPSTRLALKLIEECFQGDEFPESILDVGTGTAILAMAGAMLGAKRVTAIDNDPEALSVAHENIARNNLLHVVHISGKDLTLLHEQFDVVVANIIHDSLIELADPLVRATKKGGCLILAGILTGVQEKNIIRCYKSLNLLLNKVLYEDEWAAISLIKA